MFQCANKKHGNEVFASEFQSNGILTSGFFRKPHKKLYLQKLLLIFNPVRFVSFFCAMCQVRYEFSRICTSFIRLATSASVFYVIFYQARLEQV